MNIYILILNVFPEAVCMAMRNGRCKIKGGVKMRGPRAAILETNEYIQTSRKYRLGQISAQIPLRFHFANHIRDQPNCICGPSWLQTAVLP